MVVWLLALSYAKCKSLHEMPEEATVVRENYGVTFHKQGILDNAHSVWHQTFVVPLEVTPLPDVHLYCEKSSQDQNNISVTLHNVCPALKAYNERHYQLSKEIQFAEENIHRMLHGNQPLRTKRALLGFVGRFAKSLFGVSTEEDTTILAKQIKQLQNSAIGNHDQVLHLIDDFQSYVVKENKKFDLLRKATKLNSEAITAIDSFMQTTMTSQQELTQFINVLHIYGTQYVHSLVDIRSHLHQTEEAIQTLLQGYLPYNFVPPAELQDLLEDITQEIAKLGPFHLTHTDVGFYYHLQDIVYKLVGDKLFIKLRIPVTASTTAFTIYRIHSVPISMSTNQDDRTIIDIDKPYLAISIDKLFYMSLSESEYQFCTGNHLKRCNQALTMKESSSPSCALALFYDNPRSVAELCSVTFLQKSRDKESHIITVSDNSYLISSPDTRWIQICPGKAPVQIVPCKLCIVKLPCACSLKGQTFYIPPTLQHCHKSLTPLVNHSLNLAALFHFYENSDILYNLTSKSAFANPVIPEIPKIEIITKEFKSVVQKESKVKLSLKHIVSNLKRKQRMYSDTTSKFSTDLGLLMQPEVSTVLPVISCINFVLVLIALATSVNFYCKMLVFARSAHALNILPTPEPTGSSNFNPFELFDTTQMFLSLLVLTLVFVLLCCRKRHHCDMARKAPHTKITVVFFGNNDYIPVNLTHTGFLAKDLKLHLPGNVMPEAYFSLLSRRIYVKWGLLSLTTDTGYCFRLPQLMTVPLSKILRARTILFNLTEIQIMACTFGEYVEIYKWIIPKTNMFATVMSTSINPALQVSTPSDG